METRTLNLDRYVLESLMVDLVGHDRRPSAFILYLALHALGAAEGEVGVSLQGLATASGLSKTAVQRAVIHLVNRNLVTARSSAPTHAPRYRLHQPWRR